MKTLKSLRETKGLKQPEIAMALGVSKQTVYKWERGMSPVAPVHWKKYAALLGVDDNEFEDILIETLKSYAFETLDINGLTAAIKSGRYNAQKLFIVNQKLAQYINPDLKNDVRMPAKTGCLVPIITSAAAATCNPGIMPLLDYVKDYSEEQAYFKDAREGDFVIEVTGESMLPWYPEGTLLLVRPYQQLSNGKRVVAVLDDGEIVFKVYAANKDKICLFSINGAGKDFIFDRDNVKIRYLCTVIASQKNEARLDTEMRRAGITHGWQKKLNNL